MSETSFLITEEDNNEDGRAIAHELDIIIKNVSVLFETDCTLDIKKIASSLTNVKLYKSAAIVQFRSPPTTVILRRTGKITVVGVDSEKKGRAASKKIVRKLQRLGIPAKIKNYHVVNLLANCLLPWKVKLNSFSNKYQDCSRYEPEILNSCHVKFQDINAHIDVFYSGILRLITKRQDDLVPAVARIYAMTSNFKM